MTMKERMDAAVREQLRSAVDGERKEEIIEELSGNLYAKYEELVRAGTDPEEAYGQAMDGLGDVSELIELAGGTKMKAEFDAAVNAVTDFGRAAADGVKDAWNEVKEPLKDVGRNIKEPLKDMGRSIRDAMKSLEITVTIQDQKQFDYVVQVDDILGLDVNVRGGDVKFYAWDEDVIQVIERSSRALDENKHASFRRREDGVLCIEQGGTAVGLASFRFGLLYSDLDIYLPRRLWRSINAASTSGDVIFEDALEAEHIRVETSSGDVDLGEGVACDTLFVKSASSDVTGRRLNGRSIRVEVVSGSIELELAAMPEELDLKTVSGDLEIGLPENDGFGLAYKLVSGDLDAEFEMTSSLSRKEGVASYKGVREPLYKVTTVSGDIQLRRVSEGD